MTKNFKPPIQWDRCFGCLQGRHLEQRVEMQWQHHSRGVGWRCVPLPIFTNNSTWKARTSPEAPGSPLSPPFYTWYSGPGQTSALLSLRSLLRFFSASLLSWTCLLQKRRLHKDSKLNLQGGGEKNCTPQVYQPLAFLVLLALCFCGMFLSPISSLTMRVLSKINLKPCNSHPFLKLTRFTSQIPGFLLTAME